jgi:hypothetical protein
MRVDRLQRATSVFSVVRKFGKEGGPRHIVYRLGEHAACQAFDVQIFDRNCSEVLYQPEREFVLKLVPLVLNTLVNLLQQPLCGGGRSLSCDEQPYVEHGAISLRPSGTSAG